MERPLYFGKKGGEEKEIGIEGGKILLHKRNEEEVQGCSIDL